MAYIDNEFDDEALIQRPMISIGVFVLILVVFLASTSFFFLVFFIERPLLPFQFIALSVSLVAAVATCLHRLLYWKVKRWQWRRPSKNGCMHARLWYTLTPPAVVLGVLLPRLVDGWIGDEVRVAFLLSVWSYFVIFFGWGLCEVVCHYWLSFRHEELRHR